jgi:hypothetical protein
MLGCLPSLAQLNTLGLDNQVFLGEATNSIS